MYSFRLGIFFLVATIAAQAQILDHSWRELVTQSNATWYGSTEATSVAENVLLYQRTIGGWPKNIAIHKPLSKKEKKRLMALKAETKGCTIDNGATYLEMTFLSRLYEHFPEEKYKEAFIKGVKYIISAQYENGGWPQFYPLQKGYYSHITYNDDAMTNVLFLLKEIKDQKSRIAKELDRELLQKVSSTFDKGLACILQTQYKQNGVLTAWCAQYDEVTLEPAKARSYELPSLSGKESAKITLLLMQLEKPSDEVIDAVNHAVQWFEKTKIEGLRKIYYKTDKGLREKRFVSDSLAPPLWARFMELEDNTPFFCDRDGIKKASVMDIGRERRAGYAWYSDEPQQVLDAYQLWQKRHVKKVIKIRHANEFEMTVAQDGSGDYTSIQEAIYNCKSFPYERITIHVKNGVYKEKVHIPEWNPKISLIGESKDKTIITFNDYFDKLALGRNSTFYTPTVLVEGDYFVAQNLTIENTAGPVGQAVALAIAADKVVIDNCNLLGNQDTLYLSGSESKQYFTQCYIEGTVDFIFGGATAYFENCEIQSKSNSFITAASTPQDTPYGFVFDHCDLKAANGVDRVYLGRPWRIYAKTVFLNCTLGGHIIPEGWHNWGKPEAERLAFYAEYNSQGPGGMNGERVSWSHQLKSREAQLYTKEAILGKDTWYNLLNKQK